MGWQRMKSTAQKKCLARIMEELASCALFVSPRPDPKGRTGRLAAIATPETTGRVQIPDGAPAARGMCGMV
jgi:hypothetical protein